MDLAMLQCIARIVAVYLFNCNGFGHAATAARDWKLYKIERFDIYRLTMTISNFNTRRIGIPARRKDEAMFWSLVSLLVFGFTLGLTNFNPDIPWH